METSRHELMTRSEVASMIRASESAVSGAVKRGTIPAPFNFAGKQCWTRGMIEDAIVTAETQAKQSQSTDNLQDAN